VSAPEYPSSAHHWEAAGVSACLAFVGASEMAGTWLEPLLIIAGVNIAVWAVWMFATWLTEDPIR
jgi:hypothetical protein